MEGSDPLTLRTAPRAQSVRGYPTCTALAAVSEHGLRLELPVVLEAFAVHLDDGRLVGAADRIRGELGLVAWPAQRAEVEHLRDERALAEGAALEDPVAWLRRGRGRRNRPERGWESLTPTELEVARRRPRE